MKKYFKYNELNKKSQLRAIENYIKIFIQLGTNQPVSNISADRALRSSNDATLYDNKGVMIDYPAVKKKKLKETLSQRLMLMALNNYDTKLNRILTECHSNLKNQGCGIH
jgi:hypothetical protein